MTKFLSCILLLAAAFGGLSAGAQTLTDTLTDRRVTMYLSDRMPMIPAGQLIIPPALKEGDLIAIVTPSSDAPHANFSQMVDVIEDQGFRAYIGPHARGHYGTYAGTARQRYEDLRDALMNPEVKAIICTRGGYGAVHLLADLDTLPLRDNPKWIVGFSDISALHSLMNSHGVASLHGPMGVNLRYHGDDISPSCQAMFDILSGSHPTYEIDPHRFNREGTTTGQLVGGNLAVIDGLVSTPFDVLKPGTVLFIEDVAEPVYKIERQLYKLKLSGVLENLAGLIVGDFTETEGDANYRSMETMIRDMVKDYDYPVAFGVPAGHARVNIPLILGAPILMDVTEEGTLLYQ